MGFFSNLFNRTTTGTKMKLISETSNGFYAWNGKLYSSDIVRACIRPKVKAIGKLEAKHIRFNDEEMKINPDPYMRFLLEEPNPYMSGQMLQEKVATQLALNNNAFILIVRDANGMPMELYPLPAEGVETRYDSQGNLTLRFLLANGRRLDAPYSEIIHLREDFASNDIFGDSPAKALGQLMELVSTIDQGVVKAVKNGSTIKWLLKFKTVLKPEDVKARTDDFASQFLSVENGNGSVAGIDPTTEAQQVNPTDFVPNSQTSKQAIDRIYSFFNTNEKIVQSKMTEDEWNSYYELQVEPLALQMKNEFTRKLFTRRERAFGNYISFDMSNLACASISTKLGLVSMVDRGALTPNEWRETMSLTPIEGGDQPLRRLDTIALAEGGGDNENSTD